MGGLLNHLREKREQQRLTREAIAALVHVSERSLARYEAGERVPPYPLVVLLALLYGCMVSDLVPEWGNEVLDMVGADRRWQDLLAVCRDLSYEDFEVITKVAQGLRAKAVAETG